MADPTDGGGRPELDLEPASRISLTATVAERLAELIIDKRLGPGDRLPAERELASRLQVSRIVVREAMRALAERGMVSIRPGVGTFVVPMAKSAVTGPMSLYIRRNSVSLHHLFELRSALEPAIASAAAQAATEESLESLADNLERTGEIVGRLDREDATLEAFAWADLEFHQLLAKATGNPLYQLVLDPLIDRQLEVRREGARLEGAALKAFEGHRAVYERVASRDATGAALAMTWHLQVVASWLAPERKRDPRPEGQDRQKDKEKR